MHEYQTYPVMNLHRMNYPYFHPINFVPYQETPDNNHRQVYWLERRKKQITNRLEGIIEFDIRRLAKRSKAATDGCRLR
jgi:hypothetical protein